MFYAIAEPIVAYFRNISLFYKGIRENIIMYGNVYIITKSNIIHPLAIETEFKPIAITYSRVRNKRSPTIINFLTFFQGLRPYSGLHSIR